MSDPTDKSTRERLKRSNFQTHEGWRSEVIRAFIFGRLVPKDEIEPLIEQAIEESHPTKAWADQFIRKEGY